MARKGKAPPAGGGHSVLLMPGIYNETLKLLAEAHDYFYRHGETDQAKLGQRERIMFASEMSRITIRLSCVMAWLVARKAVFMGKLSEAEANESFRLDCREIGLNQHIEAESILPAKLTELLDKSYELYARVARLDDAMKPVTENIT